MTSVEVSLNIAMSTSDIDWLTTWDISVTRDVFGVICNDVLDWMIPFLLLSPVMNLLHGLSLQLTLQAQITWMISSASFEYFHLSENSTWYDIIQLILKLLQIICSVRTYFHVVLYNCKILSYNRHDLSINSTDNQWWEIHSDIFAWQNLKVYEFVLAQTHRLWKYMKVGFKGFKRFLNLN